MPCRWGRSHHGRDHSHRKCFILIVPAKCLKQLSHRFVLSFVAHLYVLHVTRTTFYSKTEAENSTTDFVALRDEAADMHKQAMSRDAGRHEVMIQVAKDVQLLCSNLQTSAQEDRRLQGCTDSLFYFLHWSRYRHTEYRPFKRAIWDRRKQDVSK